MTALLMVWNSRGRPFRGWKSSKARSTAKDETSVSSEDFDMNDSTWMSADQHLNSSLSPSQEEGMRSPQNLHSQED
ncbi:UNVERIFIED_CONTAM: Nucleolar protein 4-like, partial [Gekko kuhli]